MSANQNHPDPLIRFKYLPAKLCEYSAGWIIDYSVQDPYSGKMRRKQIKLNRIVSRFRLKKDARAFALDMVNSINMALASGENPFITKEDARTLLPLKEVFSLFIDEKTKELRPHSLRSYVSFVSILSTFLNLENVKMSCCELSPFQATCFMDYAYNKRNVSQTTYNNYRKLGKALCTWMIEKCYLTINPFDRIKPKAKNSKKRILIPCNVREDITKWFSEHCPAMNIVIRLVYNALIRPNEILQIKIGNIHLDKHYIVIPADVAKNHKQRFATITPEIENALSLLHLERYPGSYYLFGESLLPEKEHAGHARFRKEWDKVRKALKLPDEMQLYSFRDTGISDMLKSGIDDLTIMQHADHHSLSMTTVYAKHVDPNLTDTIYNRAPKF